MFRHHANVAGEQRRAAERAASSGELTWPYFDPGVSQLAPQMVVLPLPDGDLLLVLQNGVLHGLVDLLRREHEALRQKDVQELQLGHLARLARRTCCNPKWTKRCSAPSRDRASLLLLPLRSPRGPAASRRTAQTPTNTRTRAPPSARTGSFRHLNLN